MLANDKHWDPPLPRDEKQLMRSEYRSYQLEVNGIKLAIDLLLPSDLSEGSRIPCVLHQARYYRSAQLTWPFNYLKNWGQPFDPKFDHFKQAFVQAGFAVVSMDVRGTGASGGMQEYVWHPGEADDACKVIDHIIGQSWSDGRVALWGASYDAGAAARAAARCHPAVKALLTTCLFGDVYREFIPGGITNTFVLQQWSKGNDFLDNGLCITKDHGDKTLAKLSRWLSYIAGPSRPGSRSEYSEAIKGHRNNWDLIGAVEQVQSADHKIMLANGESHSVVELDLHAMGVFQQIADSKIPWLNISGWYCPTASSLLRAFATHRRPGLRFVMGPWNHHMQHVRLKGETVVSQFDSVGETVRFLQQHVPAHTECVGGVFSATAATLLEPELHFYVGGHGTWRTSKTWPLHHEAQVALWFGSSGRLVWSSQDLDNGTRVPMPRLPGDPKEFTCWEGHSRHHAITSPGGPVSYKYCGQNDDVLAFQSPQLAERLEICGSAVLCLTLHLPENLSAPNDLDIFIYLVELTADDSEPIYITEGCMRASHRSEVEDAPPHAFRADLPDELHEPWHSFKAADRQSLVPSTQIQLRFAMLPVGWQFAAGSCIGVLVCSACKFFAPLPNMSSGMQPEVLIGGESMLHLPVTGTSSPS